MKSNEVETVERLAKMEVEIKNLQNGMDMFNKSLESLHGKFDLLQTMLSTNYVSKETFDEYKKNKWLERILLILITAIISALIALALRAFKI